MTCKTCADTGVVEVTVPCDAGTDCEFPEDAIGGQHTIEIDCPCCGDLEDPDEGEEA